MNNDVIRELVYERVYVYRHHDPSFPIVRYRLSARMADGDGDGGNDDGVENSHVGGGDNDDNNNINTATTTTTHATTKLIKTLKAAVVHLPIYSLRHKLALTHTFTFVCLLVA